MKSRCLASQMYRLVVCGEARAVSATAVIRLPNNVTEADSSQ